MSHAYPATPPAAAARGWWARAWANPDTRSVLIGLGAVIAFHLLLLLASPWLLSFDHIPAAARPHSAGREFNIELAPEQFTKPQEPPPPQRFVETNPEAPENTPDKTNNFAAQNQQVAQEKPTPDGKSDRPAME
ncbi:MAG: hypothetical protein JNL39_13470, partial [Opitutaceae bacterium]|nr:hypothetical protein [Opitutaceae bacterium]